MSSPSCRLNWFLFDSLFNAANLNVFLKDNGTIDDHLWSRSLCRGRIRNHFRQFNHRLWVVLLFDDLATFLIRTKGDLLNTAVKKKLRMTHLQWFISTYRCLGRLLSPQQRSLIFRFRFFCRFWWFEWFFFNGPFSVGQSQNFFYFLGRSSVSKSYKLRGGFSVQLYRALIISLPQG